MGWYASLIAKHPVVILVAVAVFSMSCIIISLTTIKLPNFSDPQLGFEARGTVIANRLTAWQNLLEATKASGLLTTNPLGDRPPSSHHQVFHSKSIFSKTKEEFANKITNSISSANLDDISAIDTERDHYVPSNITVIVVEDQHHNHSRKASKNTWTELLNLEHQQPFDSEEDPFDEIEDQFHDDHDHLSEDGFFCGSGPGPEYSRVVVSTRGEEDLLSVSSLRGICRLQKYLTQGQLYGDVCENVRRGQCCRPWSLPNYIAMLHNHTCCFDITEEDVRETRELVEHCAQFYYNLHLLPDIVNKEVPSVCRKHNAVYNLMNYILDISFMPPKVNESGQLKNTVIFLPMARSSAVLEYYQALKNSRLREGSIYISAIDFGLKNTLFDQSLIADTWLITMGALFVMACMWLYTGSLFITVMTIIAIAFSLGIAYFFYTLIFEFRFFPFMNLLASIVAVGIGADDAFILSKVWQCTKAENCNLTLSRMVQITMRHSALSMFVTTLTTAAAFFSSYVSAITAIRCFSVFAGTTVLVNFVLMVSWLPASIVVAERLCSVPLPTMLQTPRSLADSVLASLSDLLVSSVLRLKLVCLCVLGSGALASVVVVFYWPRLRLPDSADFQLFASSHPFEQYDGVYKDKFWFERTQKVDTGENTNVKMPLRFVWGVVPEDNGDYRDPAARGTLRLDPAFDMAAPDSQAWLIKFCHNLKAQPFFELTYGPLLPNCFIESFVDWMNRRCQDPVERKSRAPCCESAKFPFTRRVFNTCLSRAIADLYRTPRELFMPGVAGPKFANNNTNLKKAPKVRAVVVEYDSTTVHSTSYVEMESFFHKVESWSKREMAKAPPGMRNGFFVSQLAFYDLQRTLARDTVLAIVVSLAVSLVILLMVTLNLLLSLYTILSITCIIFVTVAVLVLMGWKLNVLESVAVSVAIGLAVDFSLHYAVNYRMCLNNESRQSCVVYSLHIMSGPSLMAALTTAAAGALMLPSSVLAYIQIGVFLVVVMVVSWIYSTYFLMGLLAVVGPERNFGQLSYPKLRWLLKKSSDDHRSDKAVYINVLSESTLSTSSAMCALHVSSSEAHELDALTRQSCRYNRRVRRSGSLSQPSSRKVSLPAEQSPSAVSSTTIIHDEELNLPSNQVS